MAWRLNNQQTFCPLPKLMVQGGFASYLVGFITESSEGLHVPPAFRMLPIGSIQKAGGTCNQGHPDMQKRPFVS